MSLNDLRRPGSSCGFSTTIRVRRRPSSIASSKRIGSRFRMTFSRHRGRVPERSVRAAVNACSTVNPRRHIPSRRPAAPSGAAVSADSSSALSGTGSCAGRYFPLMLSFPSSAATTRESLAFGTEVLLDRTRSEECVYATALRGVRINRPIVVSASAISAQSSQSVSSPSVPRLINISGVFRPADGQPASAVETVTLSIYADPEGGAPLWQETQTIALDGQGRYSLLLGATQADGIPAAVFGTGDAKWLGTVFERAGEVEGPRVRITSVPYALRAVRCRHARRPARLRVPAGAGRRRSDGRHGRRRRGGGESPPISCSPARPNFLAKYLNGADVGSSGVFEAAAGAVGMGTTTPLDRLHVRYDNNTGDFTGLAVQNTNGGALAYSGMLFYDHTNALTSSRATTTARTNTASTTSRGSRRAARSTARSTSCSAARRVLRRRQRQRRHRHHHAVAREPRGQQCLHPAGPTNVK